MSEESRQKIRDALHRSHPWTGKHLTQEHRDKISKAKSGINNPNFGKHPSEETLRRKSEALKGKPCSEAKREKLRKAHLGKKASQETRKKMSEAHKYRPPMTEETKNKIRASKLHISEETRHKISEAKKGQTLSDEAKRKISLSREGKYLGENNPNWRGGLSFEPYCPKFNNEFRERVRAFFGYTCQLCGHVWQPGKRRLSVHHVNFRKDSCCANDVKPLFVPLCQRCHTKTNANRDYWERYFTDLITEKFSGQCYLPKGG